MTNVMLTKESWKPVVGYEGFYEVSDYGHIKSLRSGSGSKRGKCLAYCFDRNGYANVTLTRSPKDHKRVGVHRVVAKAFLSDEKKDVNHKNLIKADNRLCNLEWSTRSENMKHFVANSDWINPNPRKRVKCVETGRVFDSLNDAADFAKRNRSSIGNALSGRSKTSGGYTWIYLD